jgi:hypothetical protein
MTDWQPIETAPKDGTPILVYEKNAGIVVMFYLTGSFRDIVSIATLRYEASHWMPLPDAPE